MPFREGGNHPIYRGLIFERRSQARMLEAKKGFRRLKAHKNLPVLNAALQNHCTAKTNTPEVDRLADAA